MTHFDRRTVGRIAQATRIALGQTYNGANGPIISHVQPFRFYFGLLKSDLGGPDSFGASTSCEMQVWQHDDTAHALTQVSPEETMTVFNYDPSADYNEGDFVICLAIGSELWVVYGSCGSYPDDLETS